MRELSRINQQIKERATHRAQHKRFDLMQSASSGQVIRISILPSRIGV
jgi:hypothetical protein